MYPYRQLRAGLLSLQQCSVRQRPCLCVCVDADAAQCLFPCQRMRLGRRCCAMACCTGRATAGVSPPHCSRSSPRQQMRTAVAPR
jgi:hypothetical protein